MKKTISIINQKGGVGKTTTAINLGAALALSGMKVLLIDLDPQCNLTFSLGVSKTSDKSIVEVLIGKVSISEAIVKTDDNLYILPGKVSIATVEKEFPEGVPTGDILKTYLSELEDFDYIFLDCPPSLGFLSVNALIAANEVIIPLIPEVLPFEGLAQLKQTIDLIKKFSNPDLKIAGIIATRFDSRKNLYKTVLEQIKINFPELLFETVIRENVSLSETPAANKSIFAYRVESNGAEDYLNLCKEYLLRSSRNVK